MELWTKKLQRWTLKRRCESYKDLKILSAWTEFFLFFSISQGGNAGLVINYQKEIHSNNGSFPREGTLSSQVHLKLSGYKN